jgi:hypothetical protein
MDAFGLASLWPSAVIGLEARVDQPDRPSRIARLSNAEP